VSFVFDNDHVVSSIHYKNEQLMLPFFFLSIHCIIEIEEKTCLFYRKKRTEGSEKHSYYCLLKTIRTGKEYMMTIP